MEPSFAWKYHTPVVSASDRCAQIRVKEEDFRNYQGNIAALRQCQLSKPATYLATQPEDLTLSFKSAFKLKCLTQEELLDPWRGLENPEKKRELTEQDYILNEIWPQSPKAFMLPGAKSKGKTGKLANRTQSCSRPNSRHSQCSTRPSSGSSCGRSQSRGALRSRIQLLQESDDESNADAILGSNYYNPPELRKGSVTLDSKGPHAVWLSLDPRSGEVDIYPRVAARRLEGAYWSHKQSVPLAELGLGGSLDSAVVDFGNKFDGKMPTQVTMKGGKRDVRRVEVAADASDVTVDVVRQRGWRLAAYDAPGVTEKRWARVAEAQIVSKRDCATVLPPVRRQPQCFLNYTVDM